MSASSSGFFLHLPRYLNFLFTTESRSLISFDLSRIQHSSALSLYRSIALPLFPIHCIRRSQSKRGHRYCFYRSSFAPLKMTVALRGENGILRYSQNSNPSQIPPALMLCCSLALPLFPIHCIRRSQSEGGPLPFLS